MKVNRKLILISVIAILFIVVFAFFSIRLNNSKYKEFRSSGYIISTSYDNSKYLENDITSIKQYFNDDTKYKETYNNNVVFTNSNKEKVSVETNNFIHYSDGSISTLKLASILDLENINSKVITYYNLLPNNILINENGKYKAKYMDEDISFTSFIVKIDENKYIIIAPKLTLNIKDNIKNIDNSYVEINFYDGSIVRIENEEFKIQSVSDGSINIGEDYIVDLSNKNIYYNKKYKMNLDDISISMNDNVNLSNSDNLDYMTADEKKAYELAQKEKAEKELEEKKQALVEAQEKITKDYRITLDMTNPLNGISSGKVKQIVQDDSEETINVDKNEYDPELSITSFETTANSVEATINIEDKSEVLSSAPIITLVDAASNKEIDRVRLSNGLSNYKYVNETLKQNTNYVLVVNASYTKGDDTYNKDFIQKSFYTSSVGISVRKDYFTSSSLSFYIDKENTSGVESLKASLYNSTGEIVSEVDVYLDTNSKLITFDRLSSNTEYTLKLKDFVYNNYVVKNNFDIVEKYKTLKLTPVIGNLDYTIDKVNSKFRLSISNIVDKDNSLESYKYYIYDSRTVNGISSPVPSKIIDGGQNIDLPIDEDKIKRGVPYVYKVVLTYFDNEKEVELEKGYSEVMQLDGKKHPLVLFEPDVVTYERIAGNINIVDENNTVDFTQQVIIMYTDSHGITNTMKLGSVTNKIPIDIKGLRANNETYTFNIYGYVDLDDNYGNVNQLIGTFVVNTSIIKNFNLQSSIDNVDLTRSFKIIAQLSSVEGQDNTLEATTLEGITFNLYEGEGTTGTKIKSVPFVDYDEDFYSSDLKRAYYDQPFIIDEELFGISSSNLKQYNKLTIEVTNAHDYTDWPNYSKILNNVITVDIKNPIDNEGELLYTLIRNKNVDEEHRNPNVNDETIGALIAHNTYANDSKYARYVSYYIYNTSNPDEPVASAEKLVVGADGKIPTYTFYLENGTADDVTDTTFVRGNEYYVTSTIYLDIDGDGTADDTTVPANGVITSENFKIDKQSPKFYTYPSTINNDTLVWMYKYVDIDNALLDNKVYYRWNNIETNSYTVSQSDEFQPMNLDFPSGSEIFLYALTKSNKTKSSSQLPITTQRIDSIYEASPIRYTITPEINRLLISIPNYSSKADFFNKVTNVRVSLTNGTYNENIDDLSFDSSGNLVVNLFNVSSLVNSDVNVNLTFYYDSNIIGFDTPVENVNDYSRYFAIKQAKDGLGTGTYYMFKNNRLISSAFSNGSVFSFSLDKEQNINKLYNFTLADVFGNYNNFNLSLDSGGFMFTENNEYIHFYPSKIKSINAYCDDNLFYFDKLIPGVSVRENNRYTIESELASAIASIRLEAKENSIKDNKIYIQVYKTDENLLEANSVFLYEKEVSINNLSNIILEGLEPSTNYYFKVLAIMNGENEKVSLFDLDELNSYVKYPFRTLNSISVVEDSYSFKANSFNDKYLDYTFELNTIRNLSKLSYKLYKVINNGADKELVDVNIADDLSFTDVMTKSISVSPGSGFVAGNSYIVGMTGYLLQSNGTFKELDEIYSNVYTFSKLQEPFFYINYERNIETNSITYSIYLSDKQKSLVDGVYSVSFYDENNIDITPANFENEFNASKQITLNNMDLYKESSIIINYRVNTNNSTNPYDIIQKSKYSKINALNNSGIDIGDIYTSINDYGRVNLVFTNFSNLNLINSIRYDVYKDGSSILNNVGYDRFVPTLDICGTTGCANFTLNVSIAEYGIYYIQMQFLDENGNVVDERTASYAHSL